MAITTSSKRSGSAAVKSWRRRAGLFRRAPRRRPRPAAALLGLLGMLALLEPAAIGAEPAAAPAPETGAPAAAAALPALPPVSVAEDGRLEVGVGEARVVAGTEITRVALANPQIADAMVLSVSEVMILGKAPGATSLSLWEETGVRAFDLVIVDPAVAEIREVLRALGLESVTPRMLASSVLLQGEVETELQRDQALKVVGAFKDKVIDMLTVRDPVQVLIDIQVAEVNIASGKNFGINWTDQIHWTGDFYYQRLDMRTGDPEVTVTREDQGLMHGLTDGTEPADKIDLGIQGTLELLMANGDGRILAQPRLVTLSGREAEFLAGGEVPIVSQGQDTFNVEYKPYGIRLTIQPEVDSQDRINLKLSPEMSSLDFANGVNGIPSLKTRRASTELRVADGETIIIGGLLSHEQSENIEKVPVLGSIPLFGELFKSARFRNQETELLFFLTPYLVRAENRGEMLAGSRIDEVERMREKMKEANASHFLFDPDANRDPWLLDEAGKKPAPAPPPAAADPAPAPAGEEEAS